MQTSAMFLRGLWGSAPQAPDPSMCAAKRLAVLEGTLAAYECKVEVLTAALAEMEMELACKDDQVRMMKGVFEEEHDKLPAQLVAAEEDRILLRAQLRKLQHQQEQHERRTMQQMSALRAALEHANAQLKASGARPALAPHEHLGDVASDQHVLSLGSTSRPGGRQTPEPSEGPPTPPSPGQTHRPSHLASMDGGRSSSSWDCAADAGVPLVRCCTPMGCTEEAAGARYADGVDAPPEEEPSSPRSDLSGPTSSWGGPAERGGAIMESPVCSTRASLRHSAAFGARLARNNPLFRSSTDLRRMGRGLASVDSSSILRASIASLDEMPLAMSTGAAAFGLAKAQLEIQLHQSQQRLGALQSSSTVAGNQVAGAQARLRASVRCLETLHALLKLGLELTAEGRRVDMQVLQSHLAAAVQDLARLAKFQREMGSCLDMLRLLLQRMASGMEGEDGNFEAAEAPCGRGPTSPAAPRAI